MKKMIYLLLLAMVPSTIVLADHGHRNLEGHWYARDAPHDLNIKSKSNGIKVRGLNGQWKWRKLDHSRAARNVFVDRSGNSIEVLGRNHIVHISKRGWYHRSRYKVTHYVRGRDAGSISCYEDDYYISRRGRNDYGYNNGSYYEYPYRGEGYRNDDYRYRGERDNGGSDRRFSKQDILGKWISSDVEKTVYIKSEGDGLKARFGGSSKWTFYYLDKEEPRTFIDRKGNRYRMLRDDRLEWISFDGRKINLKRE